jgi:hypothetical protein
VCHRCIAVVDDTPKILRKITSMTLDESLTVTHNKTIGRAVPQHEVAAEMTDGRSKQRTTTALPSQATTDPSRAASQQVRGVAATSSSLRQRRTARARSPPPLSVLARNVTVRRTAGSLLSVHGVKNDTAGDGTPAVLNPQTRPLKERTCGRTHGTSTINGRLPLVITQAEPFQVPQSITGVFPDPQLKSAPQAGLPYLDEGDRPRRDNAPHTNPTA